MSADLVRLVDGFRVTQTIHAGVELGVPDLLADGERTADDLAETCGADPSALYRLLRALASLGILHEADGRRFSLTELGRPLRSDVPGSLRGWVRLIGRDHVWRSWGHLTNALRDGENAFRSLHGTDVWEWRAAHPEESAIFDEAMMSLTGAGNAAILGAYDFGRFGTVVDVAGGNGTLLAALLTTHQHTRGILFDQEHVVSRAAPVLRAAGVLDRCEVVAGSFFSSVPEGGDAYVLKSIIHDWEDEESVAILRTCRDADGAAGGRPRHRARSRAAERERRRQDLGSEHVRDARGPRADGRRVRRACSIEQSSGSTARTRRATGHLVLEAGVQ